jgi:hypothetical protein
VELPSRSHEVAPGEPAWEQFLTEVSSFLGWNENKQESVSAAV